MTKILALDTSSDKCSIALVEESNGRMEFTSRSEVAPRSHAQRLLPMVKEVLAEAGFQAGKSELFPVPTAEITLSNGQLTQNPGY